MTSFASTPGSPVRPRLGGRWAGRTEPASAAPAGSPPSGGPLLVLRSLAKSFGQVQVLRHVSLEVGEAEFLTILGESGSGKTTLLRLIAGFERADSGEISIAGEAVDHLPPYRRRVNTVFQHYALFPHLSVYDNVAYSLRVRRVPAAEMRPQVEQALAMVKMSGFAQSRPATISGGQQQRVALARALVARPRLLLLDEPLSALDANLRRQMQSELKSLQREVGISFVFVTHDQEEAMVMSDRIALLRAGRLEQVASPREIYARPATAYAAQFIGHTNLLRCQVSRGLACCGGLAWPDDGPEGTALFSLRPENIHLASLTATALAERRVRFRARVTDHRFKGATELVQVTCADGLVLSVAISGRDSLSDEHDFDFCAADAARVRDSEEAS